MNIEESESSHWLYSAPYHYSEGTYLKLHTELTFLAFLQTGTLEVAQDVASEVMIEWWLETSARQVCCIKEFLLKKLWQLLHKHLEAVQQTEHAESEYLRRMQLYPPFYLQYRISQKLFLLEISRWLPQSEKIFLELSLVNELDLSELSQVLQKPISYIRNIRNLAIYDVKKIIGILHDYL